jgi:hypothetical protein
MTSPPPRVDSRPVPLARTLARAGLLAFFTRAAGRPAPLRAGCGDFAGILVCAGVACVIGIVSLPTFSQVRGLIAMSRNGGRYWDRTSDLPRVKRTLSR